MRKIPILENAVKALHVSADAHNIKVQPGLWQITRKGFFRDTVISWDILQAKERDLDSFLEKRLSSDLSFRVPGQNALALENGDFCEGKHLLYDTFYNPQSKAEFSYRPSLRGLDYFLLSKLFSEEELAHFGITDQSSFLSYAKKDGLFPSFDLKKKYGLRTEDELMEIIDPKRSLSEAILMIKKGNLGVYSAEFGVLIASTHCNVSSKYLLRLADGTQENPKSYEVIRAEFSMPYYYPHNCLLRLPHE